MSEFYLTLVSNSSMEYYPQNKTSSFRVFLAEKISLRGKWCVAVAEIHYNFNFFNVTDGNNKIILTSNEFDEDENEINDTDEVEKTEIIVQNGFYKSVFDLIDAANKALDGYVKRDSKLFSFDRITNRTEIHRSNLNNLFDHVYLEGRLGMQLGFSPMCDVLQFTKSPHIGNTFFGIPDQMLVYTDIIEPSFIGHEKSYVLKIINTEAKNVTYGDSCYKEYSHLHYMPVQIREFESVSVDIRANTGQFMPFQHGILTLKLHFKRQYE